MEVESRYHCPVCGERMVHDVFSEEEWDTWCPKKCDISDKMFDAIHLDPVSVRLVEGAQELMREERTAMRVMRGVRW